MKHIIRSKDTLSVKTRDELRKLIDKNPVAFISGSQIDFECLPGKHKYIKLNRNHIFCEKCGKIK